MNGFHDYQVNVTKRMFKFNGVPDSGGTSTFHLPKSDTMLYKLVFLLPVYQVTVCGGIGCLVVQKVGEASSWGRLVLRLKDSFKVCSSLMKLNWTSVVRVRELDLVLKMEITPPMRLHFTEMSIKHVHFSDRYFFPPLLY